jgi:alpha-glucosidase
MLLTLPGTPFLYNGEEIGMTDYLIPNRSSLRDTMATWYFDHLVQVLKMNPPEAARLAAAMSRDKNRTPMQWRNAPNAGFCPVAITPWLPVNPNYSNGINVQDQEKSSGSMLTFYRHLLRVRKANPSLVTGDFNPIQSSNPACLAFRRSTPEQSVLVVLNFSDKPSLIDSDELSAQTVRILFSSIAHSLVGFPRMTFAPYEICLIELK